MPTPCPSWCCRPASPATASAWSPTSIPSRPTRPSPSGPPTSTFADRVPELFRQAYTKLRSGKPGPVLLEIPSDLVSDQISEEDFDYVPPTKMRVAADPAAITRGVRALLSARYPVIHAGQGVLYAEATDELLELAEFLQIPVMTTLEGKSAFPENHPLSLGVGGSSQTGPVHRFLTNADVVFGVGVSFTKSGFTVPMPAGKTLIHLTNGEGDVNKDYRTDYPILGEAKLALRQFIDELKAQGTQQHAPNPGVGRRYRGQPRGVDGRVAAPAHQR